MRPAHQRFVELYLVEWNATYAYELAGYRCRGHAAEVAASRLLRHPDVQAALRVRLARRPDVLARVQKAGKPIPVRLPGTKVVLQVGERVEPAQDQRV